MNRVLLTRAIREKGTVLIVLGAVIAINAAVAGLVVSPMAARVASGEQSAAIAAQALKAAERDLAAATATLAGRTRADQDLVRFYTSILPVDLAGARRATYLVLSQIARDAQLQIQRRTEAVEPPRTRGPREIEPALTRLGITMVLKGDYESVRQFLRDVEASRSFIVIDNVAVTEGTDSGTALVLTVELSTYFRTVSHGT